MLQTIKKRIKNQRGLTLVELLAVVVILGIIAAIAVPNIGGLINNTKKDAREANAIQLVDAAKLYVNTGVEKVPTGATGLDVTLEKLKNNGLIEGELVDPLTDAKYDLKLTKVNIVKSGNELEYKVTLVDVDSDGKANTTALISGLTLKDIKAAKRTWQ
ncbi:type II secretion system protein [Pseudoneobacillus sp. C159]